MSITKLSPNWACQMGPIHCPKFLLPGKDFFRISILNITTDAGNGGLIPLFCNVQHSSARVNLRVGLLLDRSLVSSVLHATVRTFKPENLRNFFLNLGFYQR